MGNIRTYRMGKKHGKTGIRALAHRNGRRYDSQSANESYNNGYHDGVKERGSIKMDYSNSLNNRLMDGGQS